MSARRTTLFFDASVLVEGASQFLLMLDRRHILAAAKAVRAAGLPLDILRPGDFIQQYYPLHEKFSLLPPPGR